MKGALLLTGLALALLLLAGRLAPAPAPDAARWAMRPAVVVDGVTYASTGQRHGGIQADAVPDGATVEKVKIRRRRRSADDGDTDREILLV